MCLLGDRNIFLIPSSFPFFASVHTYETVDVLKQHALAVRSWQSEKSSLLNFPQTHTFKEIIHIKNYFAKVAITTTGTNTTTCTRLTKQHFELETIYKITDVYIVTHFSLLKC
jgi:hypothetical protein